MVSTACIEQPPLFHLSLEGRLDGLPLRATFSSAQPTGTSRRASSPGEGLPIPSLHHHTFSPKGVAGLSFTARIGRAQFHRARSASRKDGLAAPYPTLLRPRVARAQEIIKPALSYSFQACVLSLSWKDTHVGLRAAVERGPSQGARSGSTGPTWVPFPSFHRGGSASKNGTWPLPIPSSRSRETANVGGKT